MFSSIDGPAKAIFGIWLVTLLFAAAAVMTVLPDTKWIGYTTGSVALLLLFVLRYFPRRKNKPSTAADSIDTTSRP